MNGLAATWYVVQTQPHAENRAAAHLARQGFETYLPRCLMRRRHARRIEKVATPLFPRYLFVGIDITTQRWRSVASTIGVARLILNGDVPAAVPAGVVDELKGREGDDGLITLQRPLRLVPGDGVRIIDGVFASCIGLFEGLSDRDRVAVLLDMLGRKVRVVLDEMSVVAA